MDFASKQNVGLNSLMNFPRWHWEVDFRGSGHFHFFELLFHGSLDILLLLVGSSGSILWMILSWYLLQSYMVMILISL